MIPVSFNATFLVTHVCILLLAVVKNKKNHQISWGFFSPESSINDLSVLAFLINSIYSIYTCTPHTQETMRPLVNFSASEINLKYNESCSDVLSNCITGRFSHSVMHWSPVHRVIWKYMWEQRNLLIWKQENFLFKLLSREKSKPCASVELMPADF